MPGATDYKVYRGSAEGGENVAIDTGDGDFPDYTDLGAPAPPSRIRRRSVRSSRSAADGLARLERERGRGPERARGPDVDRRRQRRRGPERRHLHDQLPGLAERHGAPDAHRRRPPLFKSTENLGGGTTTTAGTAIVTPRAPGSSDPAVNQVQLLHVTATGGTYELQFHVGGVACHDRADRRTTRARSSSARPSRTRSPSARHPTRTSRLYPSTSSTCWVSRYPGAYLTDDVYVLNFQGQLRKEQFGPGLDTVEVIPPRRTRSRAERRP